MPPQTLRGGGGRGEGGAGSRVQPGALSLAPARRLTELGAPEASSAVNLVWRPDGRYQAAPRPPTHLGEGAERPTTPTPMAPARVLPAALQFTVPTSARSRAPQNPPERGGVGGLSKKIGGTGTRWVHDGCKKPLDYLVTASCSCHLYYSVSHHQPAKMHEKTTQVHRKDFLRKPRPINETTEHYCIDTGTVPSATVAVLVKVWF